MGVAGNAGGDVNAAGTWETGTLGVAGNAGDDGDAAGTGETWTLGVVGNAGGDVDAAWTGETGTAAVCAGVWEGRVDTFSNWSSRPWVGVVLRDMRGRIIAFASFVN